MCKEGTTLSEKRNINVGLLVNSIQNDYSTLLCKGAAISAEELGVNLLIVPGRELNYLSLIHI